MKPEEINRAIAELCGWHHLIKDDEWGPDRACKPGQPFKESCVFTNTPDYFQSRDACCEFEFTIINPTDRNEYVMHIEDAVRGKGHRARIGTFAFMTATAPQRCEAFLRLHGKWREE